MNDALTPDEQLKHEHYHTASAVIAAARHGKLDVAHPDMQSKITALIEQVIAHTPGWTDHQRSKEMIGRTPSIIKHLSAQVVEHRADGGDVGNEDFVKEANDAASTTAKAEVDEANKLDAQKAAPSSSSSGGSGVSAGDVLKGAETAYKIYSSFKNGGEADGPPDDRTQLEKNYSQSPSVDLGKNADGTPATLTDKLKEVGPALLKHVKEHPASSALDAALLASLAIPGVDAATGPLEAARLAKYGAEGADAIGATSDAALAARRASQATDAAKAIETAAPAADAAKASEEVAAAPKPVEGAPPAPTAQSSSLLSKLKKIATNPLVDAGAGVATGLGASKLLATATPPETADPTATPPPDAAPPSISPPVGGAASTPSNADANLQSQLNPTPATPVQKSRSILDNALTPVEGQSQGRQEALDTARKYASTQTPEALRATQGNQAAILSGNNAAFGPGTEGDRSANTAMAGLAQKQLEDQQKYGNTSLHALNQTGLDTNANQQGQIETGQQGFNAAVGTNPSLQNKLKRIQALGTKGAEAGANSPSIQGGNAVRNQQLDQVESAVKELGPGFPSDRWQAFFSGTKGELLSKIPPDHQAAASKLFDLIHSYKSADGSAGLASGTGITDANGVLNAVKRERFKNTTTGAVNQAEQVNSGAEEGNNFADGGEVESDQDIADSADDDRPPMARLLGLKAKQSKVEVGPDEGEISPESPDNPKVIGEPASTTEDEHGAYQAGVHDATVAPPKAGDIGALINASAQAHGVQPSLARAIVDVESGGNPNAKNVNHNGSTDHGLFQVNDVNLSDDEKGGIYDPQTNANKGLSILASAQAKFPKEPIRAIYAYNHGEGAAAAAPLSKITSDPYVKKVLAKWQTESLS